MNYMKNQIEKFLILKLTYFKAFLKTFIKQKPFLASFILLVFLLHISLFTYSLFLKTTKKFPEPKKLAVKTFVIPEIKVAEKSIATTTIQTPSKVIPKPIPKPAKKPQASAKKVATTKKTTETKKLPDKRKKLIQELHESIAKMETKQTTEQNTTAVIVPKPISELKANHYEIKSETKASEEEEMNISLYTNLLVTHLKDTLALPGYGTVKIKLALKNSGEIDSMSVTSSDSEVNRLYLEKHLLDLTFPKFTEELSGKDVYTFSLTFCSN